MLNRFEDIISQLTVRVHVLVGLRHAPSGPGGSSRDREVFVREDQCLRQHHFHRHRHPVLIRTLVQRIPRVKQLPSKDHHAHIATVVTSFSLTSKIFHASLIWKQISYAD